MEKIWLKSYDKEVPEKIVVPPQNLNDLFDQTVKKFPSETALIYFGKRINYKKLNDLVMRFASSLLDLGVRPNDRIALHLPNIPQFVVGYLAILKIGAVAVPVNPTFKGEELKHILINSGSRAVITITKFLKEIEKVKNDTSLRVVIVANVKDYLPWVKKWLFTLFRESKDGHRLDKKVFVRGVLDFKSLAKRKISSRQVDYLFGSRKIALLQYTGGTTGFPKGTVLTHRNLAANSFQIVAWMPDFKEGKEITSAILPFFHIYGLTTILNTGLITASTIVLFPEPNLKELLGAVKKYKITLLPGVPILYERILKEPRLGNFDLSSIKFCLSGAAPLNSAIQDQFEKLTGAKLVEGYGLTEASPVTHVNPLYGRRKEGSIGLPISSTTAKIIDLESGKELGAHEIGELIVSGPQIMKGYWQDKLGTQTALKYGWLYTGDIGYFDPEGYFYIVDRKKDMIFVKGSGLKVYPSEVEEVIKEHPLVEEVVVCGIKDEQGFEVPAAFIVLKKGVEKFPSVASEIIRFCEAKNLAEYKIPRKIEFVEEIPKTIIGKPLRRAFKKSS